MIQIGEFGVSRPDFGGRWPRDKNTTKLKKWGGGARWRARWGGTLEKDGSSELVFRIGGMDHADR